MAHAATLRELGEGLIKSVSGKTPQSLGWKKVSEQTAKVVRDQTHPRTNQFEVKGRLDGLVEKFSVLNREDLAEGLQARLDELSIDYKWLPEVFALLLELSDQPAKKTDVSVLQQFSPERTVNQELLLARLLASDARDEQGLWENIERGYHSSGDESAQNDARSEATVSTQATSLDHSDLDSLAASRLSVPDDAAINALRAVRQTEREIRGDATKLITELQFVREMLTMFRGQATFCFSVSGLDNRVTASPSVKLANTSHDVVAHISTQAADIGTKLNYLRHWSQLQQTSPHLQGIQTAVTDALGAFNISVNEIERRFVSMRTRVVVSIIDVFAQVRRISDPLVQLSRVIREATSNSHAGNVFRVMDALYDAACTASLTGDLAALRLLANTYLAGLKLYLRIVADWVQSAFVRTTQGEESFVSVSDSSCDLGAIWQQKFSLRRTMDNSPFAPKCIHTLIDTIFASGKSRYLLRQLRNRNGDHDEYTFSTPPNHIAFESMDSMSEDDFLPFSQLVEHGLKTWIAELAVGPQLQVHSVLLHERGLLRALYALPFVYFGKDGSSYQAFAEGVIHYLSSSTKTQAHSMLETAIARTTIGSSSHVESDALSFTHDVKISYHHETITTRLADCHLEYIFTWPVQNITGCRTSRTHSRAQVLLSQLHYARSGLTETAQLSTVHEASPGALRLRQRLLWLVDVFYYHLVTATSDIHATMMRDVETAGSIDSMIAVWESYDKQLQIALLLTSKLRPVHDALVTVLELVERARQVRGEHGMRGLLAQFDKSVAFLTAGVRGVGRAGGSFWLESLAEKLEWY